MDFAPRGFIYLAKNWIWDELKGSYWYIGGQDRGIHTLGPGCTDETAPVTKPIPTGALSGGRDASAFEDGLPAGWGGWTEVPWGNDLHERQVYPSNPPTSPGP